jgi:hypothetical protein
LKGAGQKDLCAEKPKKSSAQIRQIRVIRVSDVLSRQNRAGKADA